MHICNCNCNSSYMKFKLTSFLATLLITTTSFAQVPNYVPTTGLVGWWPFNGNANDESGNNNNGTVNGTVLTTDRFGITNKAYSFDGNADFIDCGNNSSVNISGSITISSWILANNFDNDHGIVSKMNTSGVCAYNLVTSSAFSITPLNKLRWDNSCNFLFSNAITSNNWIHVVVTYDNSTLEKNIYLNGLLSASNFSPQSSITLNSDNLFIGAHQPSNDANWSWDGKLDDIGIWNRILTTCEIQNLFTSTSPMNTTTASACDNFIWNGQTYTQSGNYTLPISNCVTESLNLTINSSTSNTINESALDFYTWPVNNQTYSQSGTYTDTITNAAGCDSIVTLNLTMNFTGINELNQSKLVVYPNPTKDNFSISGLDKLGGITSLVLKDLNGKTIKVLDPKATEFKISELKPGVYFLTINAGTIQEVIKINKE
jgi:hypothetical protein